MRLSLVTRLLSIFFLGGSAYAYASSQASWSLLVLGLFSYALATFLSEVGR